MGAKKMNTPAIAASIFTAIIMLIASIKIYANKQSEIQKLQVENEKLSGEVARLQRLIKKFQEVDDEAKDSSSDLDNDLSAELEFMQNRKTGN